MDLLEIWDLEVYVGCFLLLFLVGNLWLRSFCRLLCYYDCKVLNKQILTFLISLDVTKYSS
jgi:hypothetical protein